MIDRVIPPHAQSFSDAELVSILERNLSERTVASIRQFHYLTQASRMILCLDIDISATAETILDAAVQKALGALPGDSIALGSPVSDWLKFARGKQIPSHTLADGRHVLAAIEAP